METSMACADTHVPTRGLVAGALLAAGAVAVLLGARPRLEVCS